VQRGTIRKGPRQHGVTATRLGLQARERQAYRLAQPAADADAVPVRCLIVISIGHVLTRYALSRPASRCPVIETLLPKRILIASLGAGRVSSQRTVV